MPFGFKELDLPGVKLIEPEVFEDQRGWFMETYVKKEFEEKGIDNNFIQDNHSKSSKNVLRGLHYQLSPYSQAKLVRCLSGEIYDVAVDLRTEKDSFGGYVGVRLSESNKKQLFVPKGFAHGFLALTDEAEVAYKIDNKYAPDYEAGIHWNDSTLDIDWPVEDSIVSEKDQKWPTLDEVGDEKLF